MTHACLGTDFEEIPYKKWNSSDLLKNGSHFKNLIGNLEFIWPKSLNVSLLGNYYLQNFQGIYITYSKWTGTNSNGVPCKSEAEINSYIDNLSLSVIFSSAYYDFDDYNDPIKYYIDDQFFFTFMSGFTVRADFSVRENLVDQMDNVFSYQKIGEQSSFINVESFQQGLKKEDEYRQVFVSTLK